ncbi:hypothetical protein [Chishuiella sp.]|uniref:hypothetical protein n=1 Tax=Chishuiella sp. TaxID=1969467 RepID=UPI0028B24640|nr:hypothetical protein [Chishuiella sp.]
MKNILIIYVIFSIAFRPILPVINYAINYEYIVENFCENREKPEILCNGKYFLSKELSKTNEKTNTTIPKIFILFCDVFLKTDHLFIDIKLTITSFLNEISSHENNLYKLIFSKKLFRPPSV